MVGMNIPFFESGYPFQGNCLSFQSRGGLTFSVVGRGAYKRNSEGTPGVQSRV